MPVYNAAETLVQTLESIAGQSFEDFEVVAVDDGSEDGSGEILQGWVEKDCRFRVLLEEHRGIVETPNRGLGECRGEFVARMAADDKMHPQRLDKQVGMLDADEGLSVVSCLVETFPREDVGARDDYLRRVVERLGRGRGYFAEFFHREPACQSVGDDAAAGKRFAKVPEILHYWREHGQRATHTNTRYSVENFLRAKVHYLCAGPLAQRDGVVVWGAGKTGRRIAKHLERGGCAPEVFVDITPKKIGGTLRGKPVISPDDLPVWWRRYTRPILLVAVASRGARVLIREHLGGLHMVEGEDFLCVA